MPQIVANALTTGQDATGRFTYTTASISPAAKRLYLLSIYAIHPSAGEDPSGIVGLGLTWTKVISQNRSDDHRSIYRASSITAPTPGTIAITFPTQQTDCRWNLAEFENAVLTNNGADAIVQTAVVTGNPVTTITVTLNSFEHEDNATYGLVAEPSATISPGSGFTELGEGVANGRYMSAEWKNSNDTSVDWSWSGGASVGAVALEMRAIQLSGGGAFLLNFM